MNMLSMTGQVLNVLEVPKGKSRDGKEFGGYHQVQVMCEEILRNGEKKISLQTLSTDEPDCFREHMGKHVSFPVGVYPRGGEVVFFLPPDSCSSLVEKEGRNDSPLLAN